MCAFWFFPKRSAALGLFEQFTYATHALPHNVATYVASSNGFGTSCAGACRCINVRLRAGQEFRWPLVAFGKMRTQNFSVSSACVQQKVDSKSAFNQTSARFKYK